MENEPLYEFCNKVQIGDYLINYVKLGSGPTPIFCYPGLLGSFRHSSNKLMQRIANEEDGRKYTVYTWDTPGYYLSSQPPRKSDDISFDAEVELSAQLLNLLEPLKTNWILIGFSAGNQVALRFTVKYPHLVQKLVIWGGWDLFDEDHLPTHLNLRNLKSMHPDFLAQRLRWFGASYDEFEKIWHAWMDMIQCEFFNQNKKQWVKRYERITCPTLIIAGGNDQLAKVAQSEHFHREIKGSKLEVILGATHGMQVTHAEEAYLLIHNFL